jgi:hypothetical protein
MLRVELHWDEQNWRAVAATVERLYPDGGTDLAALTAGDHARLMRGAVAARSRTTGRGSTPCAPASARR